MKNNKLDKRLDEAKKMPKLHHTMPGECFDAKSSEVLEWIASQPPLMLYLFDKVKSTGKIEYDAETSAWRGIDWKEGR